MQYPFCHTPPYFSQDILYFLSLKPFLPALYTPTAAKAVPTGPTAAPANLPATSFAIDFAAFFLAAVLKALENLTSPQVPGPPVKRFPFLTFGILRAFLFCLLYL